MRGMQRTENVNLQIHEEEVGRANNDFCNPHAILYYDGEPEKK